MHIPVLAEMAVDSLVIEQHGVYLDATFGEGGHSRKILSRLSDKGRLIAIDKDPEAVARADKMAQSDSRFQLFHADFADFADLLAELGVSAISGALFDLGVSSNQLDQAQRGFSFQQDGPLDMRMDNSCGQTLAQWLDQADEQEIVKILRNYGEEPFARSIARAIIHHRPVKSTGELAEIIVNAYPRHSKKHPATRSFQALRIYINGEMDSLSQALGKVVDSLVAGGRLVVISFHSLEDRMVKQHIVEHLGKRPAPSVPSMEWLVRPSLKSIGKCKPDAAEIAANPRARSAILRVAEKLPVAA